MRFATLLSAALALGAGGVASATTLTFDDLPGDGCAPIPAGYGGLNWSNMWYLNALSYPDSGYYNGRVSGDKLAFDGWGEMAIISDIGLSFNSAYMVAAWNDGLHVQVDGYDDGTLKYSKTVILDTSKPVLVDFDFANIDELRFNSYGGTPHAGLSGTGTHFAIDNFTFNEALAGSLPASVVPLPTAVWGGFVLMGGLGVGRFLRRRV